MKKIAVVLLLGALMLTMLSGCLPVDGEPEGIGAGMAPEGEVSRTVEEEPYEPETIDGWGDGLSSTGAYSWNGALLEEVTKELGLGYSQLCWIDDQTVTAVFGEDVFADGVCHDGVFRFTFSSQQEDSELAAAAGLTEEELRLWAREWSWPDYRYMARGWELAVTYQPLPEGRWVTPSWWLPPQGLTGRGEEPDGPWPDIAGPFDENGNPIPTPEPTPFPEDRQAVEDFKFPGWEPVEGHEGYEISTVHTAADGRPLQVRLRWKNEEGFGFWAQLPAHALDTFWEHENEWFQKATVPEGRDNADDDVSVASEAESSASSTIYRHNEEGTFEIPADFPLWEDAEEPESVEGVIMELLSIEDERLDEEPDHEPYLDWKVLSVNASLEQGISMPGEYSYYLDCFLDGEWHTVYKPYAFGEKVASSQQYGPGEYERKYYVPACALWRSGEYRICHKDLGAFEFTIE